MVIKSTTLTTRILRSGKFCRRRSTAARVSSVGTSPAQAITTSGSLCWSVLAQSQMPIPFDVPRHLQPLGVLIEHGINNVDESFVTRKQAVPPGQQITLEPSLAHVFAKHLDHASIGRKMLVNIENLLHPHLVGSFQ